MGSGYLLRFVRDWVLCGGLMGRTLCRRRGQRVVFTFKLLVNFSGSLRSPVSYIHIE